MRTVKLITYGLFIVCFSLMLLTSTVRLGVDSAHLYQYGFHKYQASQATGLDERQLEEIAEKLVAYFNFKVETPQIMIVKESQPSLRAEGEAISEDSIEIKLFKEHELVHLQDVRKLFQINYWLQIASLAYVMIYVLLFLLWRKGRWQDLVKGIRHGCVLTLCLIAVMGIVSIFNFEQLFIQFHYLVFGDPSTSPWMLDPGKDYLIMLFPPPFWQDIAMLGGITIAAEALLIGGIAWLVPFVYQKRRQSRP